MTPGQPADHEKPHPLGGFGGHLATERKALVCSGQVVLGHAESSVGHLDQQAGVDRAPHGDQYRRVGRRVAQRVVEQLGDQVADIAGGRARDRHVGQVSDLHPAVLLDLGHRGAQHVG